MKEAYHRVKIRACALDENLAVIKPTTDNAILHGGLVAGDSAEGHTEQFAAEPVYYPRSDPQQYL